MIRTPVIGFHHFRGVLRVNGFRVFLIAVKERGSCGPMELAVMFRRAKLRQEAGAGAEATALYTYKTNRTWF